MRTTRRIGSAALAALAALGCGAGAPSPSPSPSPGAGGAAPRAAAVLPDLAPGRYVASALFGPGYTGWIEALPGGAHRAVLNGRRVEIRGTAVTPVGPAAPEVSAGAAMPAWVAGSARARYVLWRDREVFIADRFDGALQPVGSLPGEISRAFHWMDGLVLATSAGLYQVRAAEGSLRPLEPAGTALAIAADARRALVLTVLGRARLTLDGGASYRDLTAELTDAQDARVRGDAFAVRSIAGQRFVLPDGRVVDDPAAAGPQRGPAPDMDPLWPEEHGVDALRAAVTSGLPLPDGGAIAIDEGTVGRVDLATGRATSAAALPEGSGSCVPFGGPEGPLALCASEDRARVVDLRDAPRIERDFEIEPGGQARERFVGVDGEALAFLGPCEGRGRPRLDLDALSGASTVNFSPQQSPALCVRESPGVWVERRLEAADAADVIAWVPRPGGAATAIVGRSGPLLGSEPRVEARGALRVVRVARAEPPLQLPRFAYSGGGVLSRELRARADGAVEGWLASQSGGVDRIPVLIERSGRLRARPMPPRLGGVFTAGPFALAQGEDGRMYESADYGARWLEVPPPPGDPMTRPSPCSPVGCQVGPFLRIGWASAAQPAASFSSPAPAPALAVAVADTDLAGASRARRSYRRPPPAPPIVKLSCAFAGPAEGRRLPDSFGFGVTPAPVPRGAGFTRLGGLGLALLPWTGPQPTPGGEADLGWIAPLDPLGKIRRAAVPLTSAVIAGLTYRPYEAPIGHVIDGAGRVSAIAAGAEGGCLATMLDQAGVTLPLGGCVRAPAVGVALDAPDQRVLVFTPGYGGVTVSAVDRPRSGGRPLGPRRIFHQEVAHQAARHFAWGAGVRGGAPAVVAVDGSGEALLALVDPARGTLGEATRLAPLRDLRLGSDARCAPRPDETRVVLPFDTEIGLAPGSLPGLVASGAAGVAVLRWSPAAACLDAVEIAVRDERYEADFGYYDPPGTVKKLIMVNPAGGAASSALVLVTHGQEVRQPVTCGSVAP